MKYLRHGAFIFLELVVLLVVITAVMLGVLLWRLSSAPVELDFLTPHLERAFESAWDGSRVEIGRTILRWEELSELVELSVQDVQVIDLTGDVAFALPELEVQLSLRALIGGTIAPTSIELSHARLVLQRSLEGDIAFGQKSEEPRFKTIQSGDSPGWLEPWLDRATAGPSPDKPLSYLTNLRILESELTVIDSLNGQAVVLPLSLVDLARIKGSLLGNVDFAIGLEPDSPALETDFVFDGDRRAVDLTVQFKRLAPPAFAPWLKSADSQEGPSDQAETGDSSGGSEGLSPVALLERLRLVLDGRVDLTIGYDGVLATSKLTLSSGSGTVALPDSSLEELSIRGLAAEARFDPEANKLTLDLSRLTVAGDEVGESDQDGGPNLAFKGALTATEGLLQGDRQVTGHLTIDRLSMAELERYWPREAVSDARAWVMENIDRANISDFTLDAALNLPKDPAGAVQLDSLSGAFRLANTRVHFLRPLPPVEEVSASVLFGPDTFSFTFDQAHLGAMKVEDGTLIISGLSIAEEEIYLDLGMRAPVLDALTLLDHPRLDLLGTLGLNPIGSAGEAAARLVFRFPLLADLGFEHLDLSANAALSGLHVPGFLGVANIDNGTVDLAVDNNGMRVAGTVAWGSTPMQIDWSESFAENPDLRTTVKALIPSIDRAGLGALGADLSPYLDGPVAATALLTLAPDHQGTLKLAANLKEATLAVPEIDWHKAPGREASLTMALQLAGDRLIGFEDLFLDAGDLTASGRGFFGDGGAIERIEFEPIAFRDHLFDRAVILLRDEDTLIEIDGGDINAAEFVYDQEDEAAPAAAPAAAPDSGPRAALTLRAKNLRRLRFGADRWLQGATVELTQRADGWHQIFVDAKVPERLRSLEAAADAEGGGGLKREGVISDAEISPSGGGAEPAETEVAAGPAPVVFDFRPAAEGGHSLVMRTGDMGGVLRALDIVDTMLGGELVVAGKSPGPLPLHSLSAEVDLRDFLLVNAPLMVRLLTVASLSGPRDLIQGSGIEFARLEGDFTLLDGVARSELFRVYGASLGLTAKGTIDFDRDLTNLVGTVVPAYAVNSILGEIPLIGPWLTGGEGEGLLAATYKMTGPITDPEVSVNALSALAPGFLRGLFIGSEVPGGAPSRALPDAQEPKRKTEE